MDEEDISVVVYRKEKEIENWPILLKRKFYRHATRNNLYRIPT